MAGYYKTVVENYVKYVDENIDNELESVADEEAAALNQQEPSPSEMMASLLNKITNGKMH